MRIVQIIDRGPSVAPRGRYAVYGVDDDGNHTRELVDAERADELVEAAGLVVEDEDGDVDVVPTPPAPPAEPAPAPGEPVRTAAQKRRDAKLAAEAEAAAEKGDDA